MRLFFGGITIALWAAQHHERVDGTGYPYHTNSGGISLEARILAVADVFQALAQKRPYREALEPDVILQIMKTKVDSGHLDRDIVERIEKDLTNCWKASLLKL